MAAKKRKTKQNAPHVVPFDFCPWLLCPWDTTASFEKFMLYYFNQAPPRNLNRAFRESTPDKKPLHGPDLRVAPGNWRRWAGGQDTKGRSHFYQIENEDGSLGRILPAMTWDQRAAAWDKQEAIARIRKRETERGEIAKTAEFILADALGKLKSAWALYSPSPGESLRDLAVVTKDLVAISEKVYKLFGDEPPEEDRVDPASQITDIERVNEISRILQLAGKRKNEAKKDGK